MPLYEFNCRKCGTGFEELVSLAELEMEPPHCPACGSAKVERGFSTFNTSSASSRPAVGPCGGSGVCGAGGGFT